MNSRHLLALHERNESAKEKLVAKQQTKAEPSKAYSMQQMMFYTLTGLQRGVRSCLNFRAMEMLA